MKRENDQRLQELKDSGKPIYSISRLDCINRCLQEAYLTYDKEIRGSGNIYTLLGSKTHDVLEKIVNGEASESDLLPAVYKELEDAELFGFEFPKDMNGEDSIRNGWIADMEHFCKTYKSPKKNLVTEQLFIYKSPNNNILQGYIDLQIIKENNHIDIYDYKTSSLYSGKDILEHGRQLVIYAMGKEQEGYIVDSINWIFLKYVEIRFLGYKTAKSKEKTEISKIIERRKIASEMEKYIVQDLSAIGLDDLDMWPILDEFKSSGGDFSVLPNNLGDNYKILPYICHYDLTDEIRRECESYIDETILKWEKMHEDIEFTEFSPRNFYRTQKNGKIVEDTFYCGQLCTYGKTCKYYRDFLLTRQAAGSDNMDDLF